MADREEIVEIFSELRNFADNDVHPVVSPENWHVYSKLCDLIDQAKEYVLALLKEKEAVVRCKDCKYAYLTDDGECKYCEIEKDDNGSLIELYRSWDWFCADGERKEGR